ncbi:MAG: S-methyl-5-thioribose-1-phosphate isomerase [Planctomycetaceae bacterium]
MPTGKRRGWNRNRTARSSTRSSACGSTPRTIRPRSDAGSFVIPHSAPPTLAWIGDAASGCLRLLDQTLLPIEVREIDCRDVEAVREAIRALRVRGAPAIGVAAAYGMIVGLQSVVDAERPEFDRRLVEVSDRLASSRPTAVNLAWALDRIRRVAARDESAELDSRAILDRLLAEARAIEREDRAMCAAIGRFGAGLLEDDSGVLTHCNAGGLATAGDGTALSVIFAAAAAGKRLHVYADETRPLLQGARLTMWELQQRGIPCTVICDSAAAWVMREGRVRAVVTGADRIAANGDVANKIGTYSVALAARAHGIPFHVAAPSSTFDLALASGDDIPIEQRAAEEITQGFGRRTAPENVVAYNPAFDVTPAELVSAIVTERGIVRPVNAETIRRAIAAPFSSQCNEAETRDASKERRKD